MRGGRDRLRASAGGPNSDNEHRHKSFYGQAFRERTPLNGNDNRALAFAAHMVPEPATFVLFGLGLIGLVASRRRGC